jgi:drug/metabolite transporter (DMT)-like permease
MLLLLTASLIWAFSFGLIKTQLAGLDPFLVAALRLGLALLLFAPFLRLAGLPGRLRLQLVACGALQYGLMYVSYLAAFRHLSGSDIALLTTLTPVYVALLSDACERRLHGRYVLAALVSVLAGAGVLLGSGTPKAALPGFLLVQASNLTFAAGQVWYRRLLPLGGSSGDRQVFALLYLGGLLTALAAILATQSWQSASWELSGRQGWVVLYLGLLPSGLCFFLWNTGARRVNAGTLAVLNNAKMPLAVGVSLLLFEATPSTAGLMRLGGALVLVTAAAWWTTRARVRSCTAVLALAAMGLSAAEPLPVLDFTTGAHGWSGNPQVRSVRATPDGLAYECSGAEDPWLEGPPAELLPVGTPLRLLIRLKAEGGDPSGELFYGPSFRAGQSVSFGITNDGQWHDYTLVLPPLPTGCRLRLDPGNCGGRGVLASLRAVVLAPLAPVSFASPPALPEALPYTVVSGDLTIRHSGALWNGFCLEVAGTPMAAGTGEARIGYRAATAAAFLPIGPHDSSARLEKGILEIQARVRDADGVGWTLSQRFVPLAATGTGSIRVTTRIEVERERELFHVPWLTLFPGLGTFGERKAQAVLPGIEYLDDEPSSSEADVRGPGAVRRLVSDVKLCFPMMAICQGGRYLAVSWSRSDHPAAVFDSPDRTYRSGAHLLALWYPGVGPSREENTFAPHDSFTVPAAAPLEFTFTLSGGVGETIVPALQHWLRLQPLPAPPEFPGGLSAAKRLMAQGWVDSAAYQDGRWRHAVWGKSFGPQPAADAVAFMQWLVGQTGDAALDKRLSQASEKGLREVAGDWGASVSHVPLVPLAALVFGDIQALLGKRATEVRQRLASFPADGIVRYHRREGGPDYGSTHTVDHANGLAAVALTSLVEYACWTGDAAVARRVLDLLDRQSELYANGVPRGAQTWEVPLHTPDILAAGRLVHIYVLAYAISGESRFLEQARYWAWTGLPFIYLDPPVAAPVGLYATTAVLGATNWQAPYWIGQPVQWCGLVYRSALLELARVDADQAATWNRLATGITRAGLQMSFPPEDPERRGLLPDFYHLREQRSDGPAINPGTVQAGLPDAYGQAPLLDLCVVGPRRTRILAPGRIVPTAQAVSAGGFRVAIEPWPTGAYDIQVAGVPAAPAQITWSGPGKPTPRYNAELGCLTVRLTGRGELSVQE